MKTLINDKTLQAISGGPTCGEYLTDMIMGIIKHDGQLIAKTAKEGVSKPLRKNCNLSVISLFVGHK